MTENEIAQLKQKLEEAKVNRSRAEGVIKQISSTLQNDFKLSDIKKVPGEISRLKEEIETLDTEISEFEGDLQEELKS